MSTNANLLAPTLAPVKTMFGISLFGLTVTGVIIAVIFGLPAKPA